MANMEVSSDPRSSKEGEDEDEDEEEEEEEEENSINQEQETGEEEELADYGSEDKYSLTGDDEPLSKRSKVVDRISKLPDSVISHILSMMPTRDAIKTCILSKRWRHTWASTSALIYILKNESPQQFSKFVDKTLILHNSSKIKKFVLKSFYKRLLKSSVSLWVQAVVIKQVEELSIKFYYNGVNGDYGIFQALPRSLYSCDSLIKLSLTGCSVASVYFPVYWRSLKHLTLTDMKLKDGVLQKFLTGSPLLEYLQLDDCELLKHIRINSRKVRTLVIKNDVSDFEDARERACLEISAPHVESLEILGFMPNLKCKLHNVCSLVHASLTFRMTCWEDCYEEYDIDDYQDELDDRLRMARDLMNKVGHVRNLTLGSWMVQVLSTSEVKHLPPCLNLKPEKMVLQIKPCQYDLPGIARLLRTSSMLEILVLDCSNYCSQECFEELKDLDGKNYWASKNMELKRLRIVEFVGFSEYTIELAEFLLRNASTLEDMIFRKEKCSRKKRQNYFGDEDCFGTMQKLLSLPRSSPCAKIVLV